MLLLLFFLSFGSQKSQPITQHTEIIRTNIFERTFDCDDDGIQVRINERTVYLPLKYFVFYYSMNINTNGRPAPAAAATTKKTNVRLLCVTGRRFRSTNLIPSPRAQKQNMNNVLMVNNDLNNLYSFRCLFTKRWKKKFPRPRLKMKDTHFSI